MSIQSSLVSDHHLHFATSCFVLTSASLVSLSVGGVLLSCLVCLSASFPSWVREPRIDSTLATFPRCFPQAVK